MINPQPYTPPIMKGTWTIKTYYMPNSTIIAQGLYVGDKAEEKNEIEIISTQHLDERIVKMMRKQAKIFENNPKLKELTKTLRL